MSFAARVQFFKERIVRRRWFQIVAFILILALSFGIFLLARFYLDLERFLLYGYLGVFVVNLISCATIVFPIPGEVINIAAGAILNPLLVGLVASVGATIGELTSYAAGYWGSKAIIDEHSEKYKKAEAWLNRHGSLAVFVFALLPILVFDLLGLAAGALRFPFWKFVLACWAGRVIRGLVAAYLGWGAFGFLPRLW